MATLTDEQKAAEAASWREWQTAWGNTESGAHAHGWANGYKAGWEAAGVCPTREDGHICANHPIHAQAKIIGQRQEIERLKALARAYLRQSTIKFDQGYHAQQALEAALEG